MSPPARHLVRLTVNGEVHERVVEPRLLLSDFLRHDLGLTGTHVGCEHGVCGACTILLDGQPARSCLLFAVQVDGVEVETVEGLALSAAALHPLQAAFWERHGLQCGFCTPGLLMTLKAFLAETPDPTEAQVREAIAGNLCRCTGYQNIVAAALDAAAAVWEATGGLTAREVADALDADSARHTRPEFDRGNGRHRERAGGNGHRPGGGEA